MDIEPLASQIQALLQRPGLLSRILIKQLERLEQQLLAYGHAWQQQL